MSRNRGSEVFLKEFCYANLALFLGKLLGNVFSHQVFSLSQFSANDRVSCSDSFDISYVINRIIQCCQSFDFDDDYKVIFSKT